MDDKFNASLQGSLLDYSHLTGADLFGRTGDFLAWSDERKRQALWPFTRAHLSPPLTHCTIREQNGEEYKGVNFASQDYLSLASHPRIKRAAINAIEEFGVHSAGSAALMGSTALTQPLARLLAEHLQMEHAILYPTGWAAGFGVVTGLMRKSDWIVMDSLAHACLQTATRLGYKNVKLFPHNALDALGEILHTIRAGDKENAILVVTEGLFSMDSDAPDFAAMQAMCTRYQATLLVDVAHDLGSMGPNGGGNLELQGMLGKVDLVMGSFSKTFASNGGFVACNSKSVIEYLRCFSSPYTFSNALSPVQTAIILESLHLVREQEGAERRAKLIRNANTLRSRLVEHGIEILGHPSPIVPAVCSSDQVVRLASRHLRHAGVLANVAEFPAVPSGRARFRLQVMSDHTEEDTVIAANAIAACIGRARQELAA
jgi:glycine C-acetyltransferase